MDYMDYQGGKGMKRSHDHIDLENGLTSNPAKVQVLNGVKHQEIRSDRKKDREQRSRATEASRRWTKDRTKRSSQSDSRGDSRGDDSHSSSTDSRRSGDSPSSGGIVVVSKPAEDKQSVKSEFDENYEEQKKLHSNLMQLMPKQKEIMYEVINEQLAETSFKGTNLMELAGYSYSEKTKKEKEKEKVKEKEKEVEK